LRAIGLFEPDVATRRFHEYTAPKLRGLTSRLALYASENDRMLEFSRVINNSDRAGLIEKASTAADGVETIDVTDGVSSEDWFRRRFGTHHAMKRETSALHDFFDIVVAHKPASCRALMGTAQLASDGTWQLLPNVANNARC
ncbi:MAG: alpha/beta hydrolase, partial [Gemmatimonadaceae bacterium]